MKHWGQLSSETTGFQWCSAAGLPRDTRLAPRGKAQHDRTGWQLLAWSSPQRYIRAWWCNLQEKKLKSHDVIWKSSITTSQIVASDLREEVRRDLMNCTGGPRPAGEMSQQERQKVEQREMPKVGKKMFFPAGWKSLTSPDHGLCSFESFKKTGLRYGLTAAADQLWDLVLPVPQAALPTYDLSLQKRMTLLSKPLGSWSG